MKIAKISVTLETFDQLDGGHYGHLKLDQKKLAEQFAKRNDQSSKRYILVNSHDINLVPEDDAWAKECFKVFNNETELKKQMGHKENLWYYYDFGKMISDETKLRYESFFSGFLYYYDTEVRNGMSDHTLWLHWRRTGQKEKTRDILTAYIDPPPLRHPLKPTTVTNPETKTPEDYANIMKRDNQRLKDAISNWKSPGVDGEATDPASPSGPPPPYA